MSVLLTPIVQFYRTILQPVELIQAFGITLSSLDLAAAFRLCLVMRQIREQLLTAHLKKAAAASFGPNAGSSLGKVQEVERRSFVREASAVLLVVYAGEALTGVYPLDLELCFMSPELEGIGSSVPRDTTIVHGLGRVSRAVCAHAGTGRDAAYRPGDDTQH